MELQVNQVIEELSKIDSATQQIIVSANNEKDDYTKINENRKKEYEDSLIKKMEQNIESYKKSIQADYDRILKQNSDDNKSKLLRLDAAYKQNHTEMATKILKQLTSE